MKPERLYEGFYGCLAGVVVGDAIGMPIAGYKSEKIYERFGVVEDF